jgi:hypothetical protein
VTESRFFLDDGNALPTLRTLLSEAQAIATSKDVKYISARALTRLDYPILQTLMALKSVLRDQVRFSDLEHLEPSLSRYGLDALARPASEQAS